jgi:hypothetical protein
MSWVVKKCEDLCHWRNLKFGWLVKGPKASRLNAVPVAIHEGAAVAHNGAGIVYLIEVFGLGNL